MADLTDTSLAKGVFYSSIVGTVLFAIMYAFQGQIAGYINPFATLLASMLLGAYSLSGTTVCGLLLLLDFVRW